MFFPQIYLLIALVQSFQIPAISEHVPWNAYFGSHYTSAPWSNAVRDPGGPGLAGFRPPGQYRNHIPISQFEELIKDLQNRLTKEEDIVLGVGGLGSGRRRELVHGFLDLVHQDEGMRWKQQLHQRVERIARLPNSSEHVYWQFGNEINGPNFIKHLANWSGIDNGTRAEMIRATIPVYVEYFLAPGIEAVHRASQKVYGRKDAIHIMLGSLGNARHPRSIAWYEKLLEYQIKGTYAHTLAGRHVYDVVDTLSIHYLVTAPDSYWQTALNDLEHRWIGKGKVQSLWSTEELGVRRAQDGYGAGVVLQVVARYLSWWQHHGWTPKRGRCFFWGHDIGAAGTRAADSLSILFDFLGAVSLQVGTGQTLIQDGDPLETYLFHTSTDDKRVLISFVSGRSGHAVIQAFQVQKNDWEGISVAQLHVFSPEGHQILDVETSLKGDYLVLMPKTPISLESGNTILLLLRQSMR